VHGRRSVPCQPHLHPFLAGGPRRRRGVRRMSVKTTPTDLPTRLREIGLFGGLSDETLHLLAESLEQIELQPGSPAFREGESGRDMFVLLDGEMEVLKHSKRNLEARVAILGPGDWFGEMSILDVMPRSATLRALAPSRLLRITAQDLDALYRRDLKAYSLVVL